MNEENARKWIMALRSGEYQQCQGRLGHYQEATSIYEEATEHCCLGVACEVAIQNGVPIKKEPQSANMFSSATDIRYSEEVHHLPSSVANWLGLINDHGPVLAELNDAGADFNEIADIIEQNINATKFTRDMLP